MAPIRPTNPLDWRVPIVNTNGTPTPEFQRRWATQASLNNVIVDLGTAANVSGVLDLLGKADGSVLIRGTSLWGAHTLTGDATLSDVGLLTVTGLQGRPVSAATPASGQVLEWSGSAWAPATLPPQDVFIGSGAPTALEPAGTLYSQSDTDALWSSQPARVAPAIVQHKSIIGAGVSSGTLALTSAPTVGNLVLVFVGVNLSTTFMTPNSVDYTVYALQTEASVTVGFALARYAKAGDTSALPTLWTASSGLSFYGAATYEISGVSGTLATDLPHGISGTNDAGSNVTALASGSVTTTNSNALALLAGLQYNGNANPTFSVGWSAADEAQHNNSNYGSAGSAHEAVASSGTAVSGTVTFTTSSRPAVTFLAVVEGGSSLVAHWDLIAPTAGPAGPQGIPGQDGQAGEDGERGPIGLTGAVGAPGLAGMMGLDGADGDQGPPGLVGATGIAGAAGIAGAMGPPGGDGNDGADGFDGACGSLYDYQIRGVTNGAIPFVANGVLSENASNFVWDPVNFRLGIGTNAPTSALEIMLATGAIQADVRTSNTGLIFNQYRNAAAGPIYEFMKSRGTQASPLPAVLNDPIATILFAGNGDTTATERNSAAIVATIIEPTPSATAMGGRVAIQTSPLGTVALAEVARFESGTGFSMFGANPVIDSNRVHRLRGYTVATLPAGVVGMLTYVTDALAPTFLAAVVGGGAVVTPVFYNGTAWVGA